MPKRSKDYKNARVYVIRNTKNDKLYIGSTTQSLCQRMNGHRQDAKKHKHLSLYKAFDELGMQNFYIELLEMYPCENIEQLLKKEGEYIRKYKTYENGYNQIISGRTYQEYYQDNKEKILQWNKDYRDQNKNLKLNYMKVYREINKETLASKAKVTITCKCGCKIQKCEIARHQRSKKHSKLLQQSM